MKLSDYVFKFLEGQTETVFLLSGGGIMHLVDSLGKSKLNAVCCHHEQACTIAAEGYARIKNKVGVALVTTGPGGTNAITGVAGAWLDSIPTLTIAGQVKTADIAPRKSGIPKVRAIGFQELNVIDLVKPITKYVVSVTDPKEIRYHLEKAIYLATSGRPGPVWIEIPLDIQAMEIDEKKLKRYIPTVKKDKIKDEELEFIRKKLTKAKRPLLMAGNGIRLAGGEAQLDEFLKKTKINAVTPIFTADDLITYDYPFYLGRQGMPGNHDANWAIDNCDLLLIIGERVQLTQTSYEHQKFAPEAYKIMVDVDINEMNKKTIKINKKLCMDAKVFLKEILKMDLELNRWKIKKNKIKAQDFMGNNKFVNVYKVMDKLEELNVDYNVTTANGMASVATHQALRIRKGQRLLTNAGLGHMGSGLPLAIGTCLANKKLPTICMEGDGSLMLNLQELQTVLYNKLPIKLIIFNNGGYFSIRNTHLNYFKKITAADSSSGLSIPDFSKIIRAWGFRYERISSNKDMGKIEVIKESGPVVIELMIDPSQPMLPKWSAGIYKENI